MPMPITFNITFNNTTMANNTMTNAWPNWVDGTTTANNIIWNVWTGDATGATTVYSVPTSVPTWTLERTPEQLAQLAQYERDRAAQSRKKAEALKRAEQLLLSCLSRQQRREYKTHRHFHVQGPSGKWYRITHGQAGNVYEVAAPDTRPLQKLCGHPRLHPVPDEDAMLAQKLMLETDEEQFLALANRTATVRTIL